MNELERAKVLLKATYQLLTKQTESVFVLNLLEETIVYDGNECDGSCLLEDIEDWLYEADVEMEEEDEV